MYAALLSEWERGGGEFDYVLTLYLRASVRGRLVYFLFIFVVECVVVAVLTAR